MIGVPFGSSLADAVAKELNVSYENIDVIDDGFNDEDGYPIGTIVEYRTGKLPCRVGTAIFRESPDFASHYKIL